MQKMIIGLDGTQTLVEFNPSEILVTVAPPRMAAKRLLRLALYDLGLLQKLNAAVLSAGDRAQMQWEDTAIFCEDDPLVQALIVGLGWTPAIVDSIFDKVLELSQN